MKTPKQVFLWELISIIALFFIYTFVDSKIVKLELPDGCVDFMSNLFELNLAIVIAFIIAILAEGKIKYKHKQLKRITRNSILIVIVNSIVMSSYSLWGLFGLFIIMVTLVGNVSRILGICREVLETV